MGISEIIGPLNPWYWWKLGEDSGGIALDSSGHGINGTISGDLQQGVTGPDIDSKGLRLYTTGQVLSPALGLTAWNSFTLGFWATVPAMATPNAYVTVANIGDTVSRLLRGMALEVRSTAIQSAQWQYRGSTGAGNRTVAWPQSYWHHIAFRRDAVANNCSIVVDGGATIGAGATPGTVWQSSDPLLLRSDTPIVISQLAAWDRALSDGELLSIANAVQPWPYQVPANQIPVVTGGGTTDLTPVLADTTEILANQTTSLPILQSVQEDAEAILGFWNGYQSVTLPDLQQVLANIQTSMTAAVETAGGVVSKTVGELMSWKPQEFLEPRNLSGGVTCSKVDYDASLNSLYSLRLRIASYPEDWKWGTPDHAWSLRDLAVLTIWNGDQILERHGIHTTTYYVERLPSLPLPWLISIELTIQPIGIHITVDWADGVCGELLADVLP